MIQWLLRWLLTVRSSVYNGQTNVDKGDLYLRDLFATPGIYYE